MKYEMKDTHEMTPGSIKSLLLPGVGIAALFSPFCFDCHGGLQSFGRCTFESSFSGTSGSSVTRYNKGIILDMNSFEYKLPKSL